MLFFYTLLAITMNCIIAYEVLPSCASCKWLIPNNKGNPDLGLCKMFKDTYYHKGNELYQHNFAAHCRSDENLCGKMGLLYESINNAYDEVRYEKELLDDYDELSNRCCGEVNEKDEIEELESDFFEIFQKMKKYNKKIIYETSKDLYKLFRRKD